MYIGGSIATYSHMYTNTTKLNDVSIHNFGTEYVCIPHGQGGGGGGVQGPGFDQASL